MNKIITSTKLLLDNILKCSATISDQEIKKVAENWVVGYYKMFLVMFRDNQKQMNALKYLHKTWSNNRLQKSQWIKNLRIVLKGVKNYKIEATNNPVISPDVQNFILGKSVLNIIEKTDKKIFQLGVELNRNFCFKNCWNCCGILMRIILERALDRKSAEAKKKSGLKDKINFCLSNNIFGKSIAEALQKLNHSTKITGDIVAHDSNLLLEEDDIMIAIVPFRVLIKDIFI
jgi:hypothetical protein